MSHSTINQPVHTVRRNVTRTGVRTARSVVMREAPAKAVVRQEVGRTAVRHVGPAGRDGDSVASYIHTQGSPSSTWVIPHNLGRKPLTTPLTVGGVEMVGDVVHLSDNLLNINFASAQAGTARCI